MNSLPIERKWLILLSVGVGTFMAALDGSVVSIVLPVISQTFGKDVASVEWVVTIYLLVVSGLLLTVGRLGDMRGHKNVYLAGFVIFVLGSMLCGLAPTVAFLVAFRALQAVGASMLFANSPAILTKNFPAEQRGQALGLQATMTYLGLTTGPSLGGWLTSQFGWRAVFYINVPIGLLALALAVAFIPQDAIRRTAERFDLRGAVTFTAGLVLLLLALNQGHAWGWTSPKTLAIFGLAALLLVSFVVVESRVPYPMLDLSLFRRRMFTTSTANALLNYICTSSISFLMPFYLIQGRGLNTAQAGLLLTAQPVVMAITAPLSGTASDRIGSRLPATLGMLILAVGLVLLANLGPAALPLQIVAALAVAGLGTGMFISPNNSALMGAAPPKRQGIAAGILATARNVGMAVGVGLAGAILSTVLARSGGSASSPAVITAVRYGLLAAAVVALLGAGISLLRER